MHVDKKMSWNYRVIRYVATEGGSDYYTIHEVYYTEEGVPYLVSEKPVTPFGDSVEELKSDLSMMRAALRRPPLDYTVFEKKNEP